MKKLIRPSSGQAGFISIILTAVITAVIIAGGTYVVLEQQAEERVAEVSRQTSISIQRQAQEQINRLNEKIEELEKKMGYDSDVTLDNNYEGWQTYRSDEYNYSIMMPSTWGGYSEYDGSFYENIENLSGQTLIIGDKDYGSAELGLWLYYGPNINTIEKLIDFNYKNAIVNDYVSPTGLEGKVLTGFSSADDPKLIKTSLKKVYIFEKDDIVYSFTISNDTEVVKKVLDSFKFLDDISDWVIYRNTWDSNYSGPGGQLAIDFTIWYPSDFRIEGNNLSRIIGEKGKGNMLAMINGIEKKSFNYYKENNNPNASLDDFLLQEAENMCAADGPSGSIYCKDVVITERGRTDNGYDFLRIDMTEVASFASNNWQEEYRPRGPVYIVDIYDFTNGDYHFLVIQPRDIGISDFDGLDDILRKMINSLKIE